MMTCNNANCRCKNSVVALIFVPGIMATRLKNKKKGTTAWSPASGLSYPSENTSARETEKEFIEKELAQALPKEEDTWYWESPVKFLKRQALATFNTLSRVKNFTDRWVTIRARGLVSALSLIFTGSEGRKKLLVNNLKKNPHLRDDDYLEVDSGDETYFRRYTSIPESQIKEKINRGWGELMWDFYGPFLRGLQRQESELKKQYPGMSFPVFVVGYNWMLSNDVAGARLKEKMAIFREQLIEEAKDKGKELTPKDVRFIVITHSMGGYVARAAFNNSQENSDIQPEAILHGAMPTNGSPATYQRFHEGFRGGMSIFALGKNAADMTSILGYCQGGLELLPNQFYRTAGDNNTPPSEEWLFVNPDPDNDPNKRISLPIKYGKEIFEFYRQHDKWYSMVQPYLLAPELKNPTSDKLEDYIYAYNERIDAVQRFHCSLGQYFHPTTKLVFSTGQREKDLSWEYCEWQRNGSFYQKKHLEEIDILHYSEDTANIDINKWQKVSHTNHDIFSNGTIALWNKKTFDRYIQKNNPSRLPLNFNMDHFYKDSLNQNEFYRKNMRAYHAKGFPIPAEFKLKAPTAKGDGTVHQGAGFMPKQQGLVVDIEGIEASNSHNDFFLGQDVQKITYEYLHEVMKDIHDDIESEGK